MIDTSKVDNIQTALNGGKDTSKSATDQSKLAQTFDQFLKILTVQLQNQDPTDPMDSSTFTQQLVAMSGVEQQINTNKNLESMISSLGSSQASSLVNYIGKQVDAEGNKGMLVSVKDSETGETTQGAVFAYSLPSAAESATINIMNAAGGVVYSGEAAKTLGRNEVIWDGTNSTTGAVQANGIYTFKITAKDATGKDITATTYTTGLVRAVDMSGTSNMLSLGMVDVKADDVKSVRNVN